MRISAKQKELNRQALLRAAVLVISKEGFEGASLRQISAQARMSDPVIYSYFPNKHSLLYGYIEWSIEQAFTLLAQIPTLAQMPFSEQMLLLMQTHMEVLEKDIVFVRAIFPLVFVTGLGTAQEALLPSRRLFKSFVEESLEEAIRTGEYALPPLKDTVVSMFWDFHVGVLSYWLNDQSEMQTATLELAQRSLAVINEVLKSGLLHRVVDLVYFLVRTHLLSPQPVPSSVAEGKLQAKVLDRFRDR